MHVHVFDGLDKAEANPVRVLDEPDNVEGNPVRMLTGELNSNNIENSLVYGLDESGILRFEDDMVRAIDMN